MPQDCRDHTGFGNFVWEKDCEEVKVWVAVTYRAGQLAGFWPLCDMR